jgi:hypothetical protein
MREIWTKFSSPTETCIFLSVLFTTRARVRSNVGYVQLKSPFVELFQDPWVFSLPPASPKNFPPFVFHFENEKTTLSLATVNWIFPRYLQEHERSIRSEKLCLSFSPPRWELQPCQKRQKLLLQRDLRQIISMTTKINGNREECFSIFPFAIRRK